MSDNIIQFPTPRQNLAEFEIKADNLKKDFDDADVFVDQIENILEDIRLTVNCMSYDSSHSAALEVIKAQLAVIQVCSDHILRHGTL